MFYRKQVRKNMSNKRALTSAYNMSLGFLPVIVTMLLCEFLSEAFATYIGAATCLLYMQRSAFRKVTGLPNYILFLSSTLLIGLAIIELIPGFNLPVHDLPLLLEVIVGISLLFFYLMHNRLVSYYLKKKKNCNRPRITQSVESAVVAARITLMLMMIHLILMFASIPFLYPWSEFVSWILFRIIPPCILILSILLNQVGIYYFNHVVSKQEYIPIVNTKGDVIGRTLVADVPTYKNLYINPVIRIAVLSQGMLYLSKRPADRVVEQGKTDIPLEGYLGFNEKVTEGANRLLQKHFPGLCLLPAFSLKHHYRSSETNRLIYLFVVEIDDDSLLDHAGFERGKLWTLHQIDQNIGQDFFSDLFEQEYDHLKEIIYIREIYKEPS